MLSNRPDWAPPAPRNSNSREFGSTVSTTALIVVVCSASTDDWQAPTRDKQQPDSNRARRFIRLLLLTEDCLRGLAKWIASVCDCIDLDQCHALDLLAAHRDVSAD
jgi:hypothetical protein